MATSGIIEITQYDIEDYEGGVRQINVAVTSDGSFRQQQAEVTTDYIVRYLEDPTNPVPRTGLPGWPTEDSQDWSDSPTRQPNLLYRYRYSWGRDSRELFSHSGLPPLAPGDDGQRWGNMDDASGILMYERFFPAASSTLVTLFKVEKNTSVRLLDFDVSGSFQRITELGGISQEADVTQFPFLLIAEPEPFSVKNPVDTDIFIRLSNYTFPIASGTITLFINDAPQPDLQVSEFFGGLGGFEATWTNTFSFDYDAQVDVRWEFRDTDVPANRFEIEYPFYTVPDLSGPRVNNLVPSDEAAQVPITASIQFQVEDFENDVDIDSLVLYVNNVLAVEGETGTFDVSRLENNKGYTVRFTPKEPWLYGDLIPVALFITDTSVNKNTTFFTYSFSTIESLAPRLINTRPLACTVQVPTGSNVSVDVIDGGHGLNKESITFTLDERGRGGSIILIPVIHRDN